MTEPVARPRCELLRWGRLAYPDAVARMAERVAQRQRDRVPDALILVEHEPVITLGRRAAAGQLLASPEWLAARGVAVCHTERGGQATFHGPGQLVAYPVLRLRPGEGGARLLAERLERVLVTTVRRFGVDAFRRDDHLGCWVRGTPVRKIGSVGLRLERGVSSHGVALNVAPELGMFDQFVVCGVPGLLMTSLAEQLAQSPSLEQVAAALTEAFADELGRRMVEGPA